MSHLTTFQKLKFRRDFVTLLLLIGDVNVFLACFCHIPVLRINTEIKVIVQRCQFLGTLLTISALHTVGSTWPASPKKQSCQQLFPHPSPVLNPPSLLSELYTNMLWNEGELRLHLRFKPIRNKILFQMKWRRELWPFSVRSLSRSLKEDCVLVHLKETKCENTL